MIKKIVFLISFILCISYFSFAQEELTITTYYPSPYGSYNELQLVAHPSPVTSCTDQTKGTMYLDSDDNLIYVCQGLSEGWQPISGYWAPSPVDSNNIYNTNTGNVGIGNTDPTNRLHIENATPGAIRIVDGTQAAGRVLTSDNAGVATWQAFAGNFLYDLSDILPLWYGGITPPTYNYTFTAQRTGNVLILAKGDIGGGMAGTSRIQLIINGTTIDNARMAVVSGHAGSRAFTLFGEFAVVAGTNYTVTVTCSLTSERLFNPRVLVLYP